MPRERRLFEHQAHAATDPMPENEIHDEDIGRLVVRE
jgi:hypothetical protein